MKKIIFIIIPLIVLSLNSCRSENNSVNEIENSNEIQNSVSFNRMKPIPTAESLSNHEAFRNLVDLIYENSEIEGDYSRLLELTNKYNQTGNLDTVETNELFENLGFASEEEFNIYSQKIFDYNQQIAESFQFEELNNYEIENLIIETLNIYDPIQTQTQGVCSDIRRGCLKSALGAHIATTTACIAGGIGIAGMSFGLAAPIGGALAGACAAGSQINYEGNVAQCNGNYQICVKK